MSFTPPKALWDNRSPPPPPEQDPSQQQEADAKLTRDGTTLGSPYYISPEQAASKELDSRTDIYSLGIVLYEMCTRSLPFKGESSTETIDSILNLPAKYDELSEGLAERLGYLPLALELAGRYLKRLALATTGTDSA